MHAHTQTHNCKTNRHNKTAGAYQNHRQLDCQTRLSMFDANRGLSAVVGRQTWQQASVLSVCRTKSAIDILTHTIANSSKQALGPKTDTYTHTQTHGTRAMCQSGLSVLHLIRCHDKTKNTGVPDTPAQTCTSSHRTTSGGLQKGDGSKMGLRSSHNTSTGCTQGYGHRWLSQKLRSG